MGAELSSAAVRYLITGATGFLGTAVTRRVLAEGDEAVAFVRDRERAAHLVEAGAAVEVGTVGDPNVVAAAARGCDVVVHCAAVVSHRASPRALAWINVAGTENVVRAARHARCARVVVVSCADVSLSNEDRVHWNEKRGLMHPPLDEHARTKLLAEELALAENGRGVEVTALRPAWLWGPGDRTHLPLLVREGMAGGLRLIGSGENLVSTTYVDNFVDALLSAAEVETAAGRAYYVTDGELVEAREFLGQLSEAVGLPAPRRGPPYGVAYAMAWTRRRLGSEGWWPTDVIQRGRSTCFDHQSAVADLDWAPRVSIEQGMQRLADWARTAGGPGAIAAMYRPPATASSVDAEVAAAGDDDAAP